MNKGKEERQKEWDGPEEEREEQEKRGKTRNKKEVT